MDFQGKPNIDEYVRIRTSVEVRNCTESQSLSKDQGRESLIFQMHDTFFIDFPNMYSNYLLANVNWFISLVILVNESDFSRPEKKLKNTNEVNK